MNTGNNSPQLPLEELLALAKGNASLLVSLNQWALDWVVQYAVTDNVSDLLVKTDDVVEVMEALEKREAGASAFLAKQIANDCVNSHVDKDHKTKTASHTYSVLALRKRKA